LFLGVIVVIAVIGFVTFLIVIRGRERTLVPDVEGLDLLEALPELQDRGLQYRIAPVFDVGNPRNAIISQRPAPGAVVKQGKVVELSVSKGAVLDRVPNYIGWTLQNVRENLDAVFSSSFAPLLRVAEPPSYIHAVKPEGTILEQEPAPNTPIAGIADLHFVVSLGPPGRTATIGDYVGVSFRDAIDTLADAGLPFVFTVDAGRPGKPGEIVAQSPKSGSQVPPDSLIQLWMKAPAVNRDEEVFDVFQTEVPTYVVRVPIRLELDTREADVVLLDMKMHPGGVLTVPYVARKSDQLVFFVDDREVTRIAADRTKR
jgi:beta-lactam-binding protein with PASTA domain